MKATLILANGSIFSGTSIGGTETRVCEMVFNTSMTGYQEILTDPSYAGQGVVMSYPLIGNYGVNHEDNESRRPWAEAFVVRHLSPRGSNFRCEGDLGTFLKEHNITGIQGVDTRALTKILRSQGSMNGMLTCAEHFNIAEVLDQLKAYQVKDTVAKVTRAEPEVFPAYGEEKHHVAMMDFGVKQHMIECLRRRGCKVTAPAPPPPPAQAVLSGGYDGVMLSNGPGDPAENTAIIAELKKLYDSDIPIFGVCLGHQLLALATGAKTGKLAYGHRGGKPPGAGPGEGPGVHHQPEPRLYGAVRLGGPRRGRGVPRERERRHLRGPALQAPQLLYHAVPSRGQCRPPGYRVSVQPLCGLHGR